MLSRLCLGLALLAVNGRADEGRTIDLAKVPAKVMRAAEHAAGVAKFLEATVEETDDGRTVYEIAGRDDDGRAIEVEVAADGTLVEVEHELRSGEVPGDIKTALQRRMPGFRISSIELSTRHGPLGERQWYEFDGTDALGLRCGVEIRADAREVIVEEQEALGIILDRAGTIPLTMSQVPAPILASARKAAGGTTFDRAALDVSSGEKVYRVQGHGSNDRLVTVDVDDRAAVLAVDMEIGFSELPAPVLAALSRRAADVKIERIEHSRRTASSGGGASHWYEFGGEDCEGRGIRMQIAADGRTVIIELESVASMRAAVPE